MTDPQGLFVGHLRKLDIKQDVELGENLVVTTRDTKNLNRADCSTQAISTAWTLLNLAPDADLAINGEWGGSAHNETGLHPSQFPLLHAEDDTRRLSKLDAVVIRVDPS